MTKTTFMRWKLKTLPTPSDIAVLIDKGVINKEEARTILFNPEEIENERDIDSFKAEIKFLRELVEKLAESRKVVEIIREIEKPYQTWSWIPCYTTYCDSITTTDTGSLTTSAYNFSDINTF